MVGDPASEDVHVEIRDLRFARGTRTVFRGLSCRFPRDRISVVLGASGAGKSTLLRVIACLEKPDAGEVWIEGRTEVTALPERKARAFRRTVGMMFQSGALLDSMSVFDNAALPLREHTRKSEAEIREEVRRIFDAVGLEDVEGLLPGQLSGGMVKRAALARALIFQPELLLCDEPFSGLDPTTQRLVEDLLVEVNRKFGVTMIITSHHIGSTVRMADHVVLLTEGTAVEGRPEELRRNTDARVVRFFEDAGPTFLDVEEARRQAQAPAGGGAGA